MLGDRQLQGSFTLFHVCRAQDAELRPLFGSRKRPSAARSVFHILSQSQVHRIIKFKGQCNCHRVKCIESSSTKASAYRVKYIESYRRVHKCLKSLCNCDTKHDPRHRSPPRPASRQCTGTKRPATASWNAGSRLRSATRRQQQRPRADRVIWRCAVSQDGVEASKQPFFAVMCLAVSSRADLINSIEQKLAGRSFFSRSQSKRIFCKTASEM